MKHVKLFEEVYTELPAGMSIVDQILTNGDTAPIDNSVTPDMIVSKLKETGLTVNKWKNLLFWCVRLDNYESVTKITKAVSKEFPEIRLQPAYAFQTPILHDHYTTPEMREERRLASEEMRNPTPMRRKVLRDAGLNLNDDELDEIISKIRKY